jgi:hypothetical protein
MPEFPRLKNRSGQVEWDGGSNTVLLYYVLEYRTSILP